TTRDVTVIRDVVKLVLMTTVFKLLFIVLATRSLRSTDVISPFTTPAELFDSSLRVVAIGSVLIILELVALVAVFERIKSRSTGPLSPIWYPAVYTAVLVADGLLFPVLHDPSGPGLAETVRLGVSGKLLLA